MQPVHRRGGAAGSGTDGPADASGVAHRWDPAVSGQSDLVAPVPHRPGGTRPDRPTDQARGAAAGGRSSWGLYVPQPRRRHVVEQRIIEQSARVRSYGAVTAWAALRWHGATFFDGTAEGGRAILPVPLIVAHQAAQPTRGPRTTTQEQLSMHRVGRRGRGARAQPCSGPCSTRYVASRASVRPGCAIAMAACRAADLVAGCSRSTSPSARPGPASQAMPAKAVALARDDVSVTAGVPRC